MQATDWSNALSERTIQASRRATKANLDFPAGRWHRRRVHYVYILRCDDGSLYIGETPDVPARLLKHNEGGSPHTAKKRPVTLVYSETLENRIFALGRERQLKHWTKAKKEALIRGDLDALRRL